MIRRIALLAGRGLVIVLLLSVGVAAAQDTSSPNQPRGSSPSLDQLRIAFSAMAEENFEQALVHYGLALEYSSTSELRFQAHLGMGSAAAALGRLDEAQASYESALEIKPSNAEIIYSLGLVAKDQDRLADAASLFAEAVVRKPELYRAFVELGVVYERLERHEDAAGACYRATQLAPEDVEALLCLGVARYHLGRHKDASAVLRRAVEIAPEDPRVRFALGLSLLFDEDQDGAVAQYVALKELNPDLARDLYNQIFPGIRR